MIRLGVYALAVAVATSSLAGCASMTPRESKGALIGGATGAAVGAIATRSVGGAVVGGGIGALAGYFIGKNSYRCKKVDWFGKPYWGTCLK